MTRQIEQGGADGARGADDEDRGTWQPAAVTGEHLEGGEIGERDAHRFGGIDAIRNRHKKLAYWA